MAAAIKYKTITINIALLKNDKHWSSMEPTKERIYSNVMKNNTPP